MPTASFTYADPRLCPSCRTTLRQPVAPDGRCETCAVPLGHVLATEIFESLRRTDLLAARLRALAVLDPAPAPAPTPVPEQPAPYPVVPPLPDPARTGVRTSSVPAILLGLGALCLLVAAVTFLAVAWHWLGVGGRTAVLVSLTVATGAGALVLAGRGLRLAGEALATVSLGLVVLDVLGAEHAGWLGDPSAAATAIVVGLALAAAGGMLATGAARLAVPQAAGVVGLFVAQAALPSVIGHDLVVAAGATAAFVGLAAALRSAGASVGAAAAGLAGLLAWADLTLSALGGLGDLAGPTADLTVGDLWASGEGIALGTAALLLLLPVVLTSQRDVQRLVVCAAASMLTCVVTLPVLDNGATQIALASLALGVGWTTAAGWVRRADLFVPAVPAALSLAPASFVGLVLSGQAVSSSLSPTTSLRLDPGDPVAAPALLVPTALAVVALALVLAPVLRRRKLVVRGLVATTLLAATATLALHPVPLWTVVAALTAVSLALVADGARRDDRLALGQVLGGVAGLGAAVTVATPSSTVLLLPLAALSAAALGLALVGRTTPSGVVGGLVLAPSLGGLTWVLGDLADLDAWRAVPVLVVVAAMAMGRAREEVEVPAVVAGVLAAVTAVPLADDVPLSLALHLTLAGALLVAHALLHPARRPVAWAGSLLLVAATWVRLLDLGVQAPEAYTLPTAVALVVVGLVRLRRDVTASTALALAPGLALATVPSLLRVLADEPATLRALLLGVACLVLAIGGAQLRWSAPLVVGAAVGTLLTLAELAPYATETPQWVVIGLAGTLLVVVGVTWERRVLELRRAAHYVGRLR
ncbi:hypothetical protein ABFT23_21105 [Nocardioides sp. C4-1]|uniref:SCO7613 C-terminal domain-containing membrane protein n=1 Tax=Nocardioides sp. C4-1 TaxID=3151851 RepID=UPI0032654995